MKAILGLGAGGHAKVVLDAVQLMGEYRIVGLLDPLRIGESVCGIPVLGDDKWLISEQAQGITAVFLAIGENQTRKRLFNDVRSMGIPVLTVIHPTASIAGTARVGAGAVILAHAVINPDASLGDDVIVNTGVIVEHDCTVGAHSHIAPGAILCGGVHVGESTLIGAGAVVREGCSIGSDVVVGAGAVVIKDVLSSTTVVGSPARPLERNG
jgi:UDP-perosamine 4-acetyltransferase